MRNREFSSKKLPAPIRTCPVACPSLEQRFLISHTTTTSHTFPSRRGTRSDREKYYVTTEEESRKSFRKNKGRRRFERVVERELLSGRMETLFLSLSSFFPFLRLFLFLRFAYRLEAAHEIKLVSSVGWEFHPRIAISITAFFLF